MNAQKKVLLATAAMTGLLAGAVARASTPVVTTVSLPGQSSLSTSPVRTAGAATASHGVRTMDAPATQHDCAGKNDCKGQGGCKTSDQGCKGKNSCKGKGGCKSAS
jgi:hypothetical protein